MDFSGQVLKLTLNDFELFPTTAYRYMYRVSQNVLRHIFINLKDQLILITTARCDTSLPLLHVLSGVTFFFFVFKHYILELFDSLFLQYYYSICTACPSIYCTEGFEHLSNAVTDRTGVNNASLLTSTKAKPQQMQSHNSDRPCSCCVTDSQVGPVYVSHCHYETVSTCKRDAHFKNKGGRRESQTTTRTLVEPRLCTNVRWFTDLG